MAKKEFKNVDTNMFQTTKSQKQVSSKKVKTVSNEVKSQEKESLKAVPKRETRSERKQFVFTKTMSKDLLIVARSNGISENEAVNQAIAAYLKREFKKESKAKRQKQVVNAILSKFK